MLVEKFRHGCQVEQYVVKMIVTVRTLMEYALYISIWDVPTTINRAETSLSPDVWILHATYFNTSLVIKLNSYHFDKTVHLWNYTNRYKCFLTFIF
jgi:hypothetical protein